MDNRLIIFTANGENIRFDYTAMVQEWSDFTQVQYGHEKVDAHLVAILANEHMLLFSKKLHDEEDMLWEPVEGNFAMPKWKIDVNGGDWPIRREDLDQLWADCFDALCAHLEDFQALVDQERELGLV